MPNFEQIRCYEQLLVLNNEKLQHIHFMKKEIQNMWLHTKKLLHHGKSPDVRLD